MTDHADTIRPWFKIGQTVIVSGGGVGRIVEVGEDATLEGYRNYRVNFGSTRCHCCGRESGDRIEWTHAMHISLTASEHKRLEEAVKP